MKIIFAIKFVARERPNRPRARRTRAISATRTLGLCVATARSKSTHRADVHELLGANVVGTDEERGVIVVQQEVDLLGVGLLLNVHHVCSMSGEGVLAAGPGTASRCSKESASVLRFFNPCAAKVLDKV